MKVAVFGGSGFLGYDFIRHALLRGGVEPVVYSSSARSLSNVARHELELRLYPADDPQSLKLDDDVAALVNFAHPFERRGGISGMEQIGRFAQFVAEAKRLHPSLRLIHLSSMSVHEPFGPARRFAETDAINPPRDDGYAREKAHAETVLRGLPDAAGWQLHLRPTVVYGPFCGVWTDRILEAFTHGDVGYCDLSGRIQPIHAEDVSRFIYDRLMDFKPGVYNLPGPEEMSWQAFLEVFRDIVAKGQLVQMPADAGACDGAGQSTVEFYMSNLREFMQAVRKEPSFDRMARRIASHLPVSAVQWIREFLLGRAAAPAGGPSGQRTAGDRYTRKFFAEDRLVDGSRLAADFPHYAARRMGEVRGQLAEYHRFRFTDDRFE